MEICPYCGSDGSVYRTYTGKQYYYWDGEPCGYDADVSENQSKFVRCTNCNKKISMDKLKNSEKD